MRRAALIVLSISSVLFVLSLLPAAMMIMMSPMAFDSGESTGLWVFVITLWTYPITVLAALVSSWILFAVRAYRSAVVCSLLPLVHILFAVGTAFFIGDPR